MRNHLTKAFLLFFVPCLLLGAALSGCNRQTAGQARPSVTVVVDYPIKRDVTVYFETNGFTDAYEYATIVARVPGELEEIRYRPGAIVFEGDPLFLIEQNRYLASRDAATADLASAKAELALADANLNRAKKLRETNTNTQEEYDQHFAQFKVAEAKILQAEAAVRDKELDLKYTDIRAPISGKTERNLIDRGNYVGSTPENSTLTTIANLDPIYVYFSVSASQLNELQKIRSIFDERTKAVLEKLKTTRSTKDGDKSEEPSFPESQTADKNDEPVDPQNLGVDAAGLKAVAESFKFENHLISMALHKEAGGKFDFKYDGVIDLSSNQVDPHTGTIKFRGRIPNENYIIYRGQPVQVQVPLYTEKDAVVVRDEAVGSDLNLKYVLLVADDGTVSRKNVTLGPLQSDGTRVVLQDENGDPEKLLTHSDRYIVQGIQKATIGQKVTVQTLEEYQKTSEQRKGKLTTTKEQPTPEPSPEPKTEQPQPNQGENHEQEG